MCKFIAIHKLIFLYFLKQILLTNTLLLDIIKMEGGSECLKMTKL